MLVVGAGGGVNTKCSLARAVSGDSVLLPRLANSSAFSLPGFPEWALTL